MRQEAGEGVGLRAVAVMGMVVEVGTVGEEGREGRVAWEVVVMGMVRAAKAEREGRVVQLVEEGRRQWGRRLR
jgi:hypothetical protein